MRRVRNFKQKKRTSWETGLLWIYALQHRGQESCGIVVNDDGVFSSYKDLGLVSEVFSEDTLHIFRKEIWPWDMCGTERQEEIIERIVSL